jgi:lysophospholipase L1-like esterase
MQLMMKFVRALVTRSYFPLSFLLVVGLLFHRSVDQDIFIYSKGHVIFVLATALVLFLLLPWFFRKLESRFGTRTLFMASFPAIALLTLVYIVFHYAYYARRQYLFDPFLQNPKQTIDMGSVDNKALNILCLGGSTTEGYHIPEGANYPDVLERSLRSAYPDRKIEVYNAGRAWYTSRHSLINYVTYYRRIKPDIVIVMHAINDLCRSFVPPGRAIGEFKEDYSHFYGPASRGADPPTFESNLLERNGGHFNRTWFSIFRGIGKPVDYGIERYPSLHSFDYNMRTLAQSIKRDGAVCIIAEQPFYYHDDYKDWEYKDYNFFANLTAFKGEHASIKSRKLAMEHFNEAARRIASDENVMFVQTRKRMPADTAYFMDEIHHSVLGAKVFGEEVARSIIDSGLVPGIKK